MAKLQTDLREFIALLNSHRVDYVVVGGHAVAYHGYPRFTGDIDFFIKPSPENAERLLRVLDEFGFGELGITAEDFQQPARVVQLGQPPNRIDLLTSVSGVEFDAAWRSRIPTVLDDQAVHILGLDELLKNKRTAARPKDLADVAKLLSVSKRGKAG